MCWMGLESVKETCGFQIHLVLSRGKRGELEGA
jgi:hypothetical protein